MEKYIVKQIAKKLGIYHHHALLIFNHKYKRCNFLKLLQLAWFVTFKSNNQINAFFSK